jgi:hypothetical protein
LPTPSWRSRKDRSTRESPSDRRRRVHRIAPGGAAARARARSSRARQPLDRLHRQHRAPQGARGVLLRHRHGDERAAACRDDRPV